MSVHTSRPTARGPRTALAALLVALGCLGCRSQAPAIPYPMVVGNCVITVAPVSGGPELVVDYGANTDSQSYTVEFGPLTGNFEVDGPNGPVAIHGGDQLRVSYRNLGQDQVTINGQPVDSIAKQCSSSLPDTVAALYTGVHSGDHLFFVLIRLRGETQVLELRGTL